MMDFFTFDDMISSDYGIWISGEGTYDVPKRKYTSVSIPGRNGELLFDEKTFENITISYPAFILNTFPQGIEEFRNKVLAKSGYQVLSDTFHPYEYRLATFTSPLDISTFGKTNNDGKFTIKFNCKPQRYLGDGEIPIDLVSNSIIYNETEFESKPIIRIYGNGTVGIGATTITTSNISDFVIIDCELQDAYKDAINLNSNITLSGDNFPTLIPGANKITLGSGISRVVIIPRWWII